MTSDTVKRLLLVLIGCSVLSSCNQTSKNRTSNNKKNRHQVTVNLIQNISSLVPTGIQNASDVFIAKQLYETLFVLDSLNNPYPRLVESYKLDSTQNRYEFTLKSDVRFSDGLRLESIDILRCFKKIFDSQNPSKIQQAFKNNILGIEEYTLSNNQGKDSYAPSGFVIEDRQNFSITVKRQDHQLLRYLSDIELSIFKINHQGEVMGSGPFVLDFTNEDISLYLTRNPYYTSAGANSVIEGINVRFIKNQFAIMDEFKNGSIDVIELKYITDTNHLVGLLNNPYGYHRFAKQQSCTAYYMEFHNFDSTALEDEMPLLRRNENISWRLKATPKNSVPFPSYFQTSNDSSGVEKIWYLINKTNKDFSHLFGSIDLEIVESVSNPKSQYIVIQQAVYQNCLVGDSLMFERIEDRIHQQKSLTGLAIVQKEYDLIMYNERINGFKDYSDWANDLSSISFNRPMTF